MDCESQSATKGTAFNMQSAEPGQEQGKKVVEVKKNPTPVTRPKVERRSLVFKQRTLRQAKCPGPARHARKRCNYYLLSGLIQMVVSSWYEKPILC